MTQGDSNPPDNRNAKPGARSEQPRQSGDVNRSRDAADAGEARSVDFGSYVSSTVRSSAERFGTPVRSASSRTRSSRPRQPRQGDRPATQETVQTSERASRPDRDVPIASRARPRTYWRDSVAGAAPNVDPDAAANGDGDRAGGTFTWSFLEDERARRIIYAAVAVAIVALVALIWLLNRGGGEEDEAPPTGTIESVLDAVPTATEPGDDGRSTPPAPAPSIDDDEDVTPTPAPTQAVRRGGDNQIDADDPGTPGATRGRYTLAGQAL